MVTVDANIILRYLLGDNPEMRLITCEIFDTGGSVLIPEEVLAEVVYVLEGVYKLNRSEICANLTVFLQKPNILVRNNQEICSALQLFANHNIDFVDSILLAYSKNSVYIVKTFDKKLLKLMNR